MPDANQWVADIYSSDEHSVPETLDTIFEVIDGWLLDGAFSKVDRVFEALVEEHFDKAVERTHLTVGFLTVTKGAHDQLPHRQTFLGKFRQASEQGEVLTEGLDRAN
jgi:hypothetical protein